MFGCTVPFFISILTLNHWWAGKCGHGLGSLSVSVSVSLTHTHSLSVSLSLIHTHTHTDTPSHSDPSHKIFKTPSDGIGKSTQNHQEME